MTYRKLTLPLAALAAVAAFAAPAHGQGRLGLLAQGQYVCALPGDATGAAWNVQPARSFAITGASSYTAGTGSGTYLLEGNRITFTRGPMRGMRLMRLGSGLLQVVEKNGSLGRMRCHRAGPVTG